jgi:hypothetical protein
VDHENKIIFTSASVYDDKEPQLSASQKRRLRRKKAKLISQQSKQPLTESLIIPTEEPKAKALEETAVINYSKLPNLVGIPRQGMKIAFKTLEMSKDYQPVISDYKIAEVLLINPASDMITLQLESKKTSQNAEIDPETGDPIRGKFDLPDDDEYMAVDSNTDMITVSFSSLMHIKHIV